MSLSFFFHSFISIKITVNIELKYKCTPLNGKKIVQGSVLHTSNTTYILINIVDFLCAFRVPFLYQYKSGTIYFHFLSAFHFNFVDSFFVCDASIIPSFSFFSLTFRNLYSVICYIHKLLLYTDMRIKRQSFRSETPIIIYNG